MDPGRFKTGEVLLLHLLTSCVIILGSIAYAFLERSL